MESTLLVSSFCLIKMDLSHSGHVGDEGTAGLVGLVRKVPKLPEHHVLAPMRPCKI